MLLQKGKRVFEVKSVLYVVSLYGSTLHKMCIKYLKESNSAKVTILELPSVKLLKHRLCINAFLLNENEEKFEYKVDIFFPLPHFFTFVIQYILNFYILFKLCGKVRQGKFDICIGENNYNGAIALILKKIRKCKFSVFMNGDIIPETPNYLQMGNCWIAFLNKLLETLLINVQYILRSIAYKSDLVWYPSEKIKDWDMKGGFCAIRSFTASSPVDSEIAKRNLCKQRLPNTLCYIGGLYENSGLDIMISSIKIAKEKIQDINILVVGGSAISIEKYEKLAGSYGVTNNFRFYGYLPEKEAEEILKSSVMGFALYKPVDSNVSIYTDVSKVKTYLNAGLPVIITRNGPEVWRDIEKFNAGIVVEYNEVDIANNIINILQDSNNYTSLKDGVLKFSEANDYKERCRYIWDCIVTECCKKTGNLAEETKKHN